MISVTRWHLNFLSLVMFFFKSIQKSNDRAAKNITGYNMRNYNESIKDVLPLKTNRSFLAQFVLSWVLIYHENTIKMKIFP